MKNGKIEKAYNGSYYTIIGCGGDLNEWKNGYQEMLDEQGIGKITEWLHITGKEMNDEFELTDNLRYKDDLNILAFSLEGLKCAQLAMFKIRMMDRWFDDVVDNLKRDNYYEGE